MRPIEVIFAKKMVAVVVAACAVWAVVGVTQSNANGASTVSENGDTNGDGSLNLPDAVYLLNHLFASGPPPVPYTSELTSTGQTQCYDNSGLLIGGLCPNAHPTSAFGGQDAYWASQGVGCSTAGRFQVQSIENPPGSGVFEEVVIDHCTGLMWQKDLADPLPTWGNAGASDWEQALSYCNILGDPNIPVDASFQGAGFDDWRLPNVNEMLSIVNFGGGLGGSNDHLYPEFTGAGWHWTSTTREYSPGNAFLVGLHYDTNAEQRLVIGRGKTSQSWSIRAVRSCR